MKNWITVIIVVILFVSLSLTGCGKQSATVTVPVETPKPVVKPISSEKADATILAGFKIGLSFSQILDKLPNNATIKLEESQFVEYYAIQFDQQLLNFDNNGLLLFILAGKTGTGLDNGIMVGDSEGVIKNKMGSPKQESPQEKDNFYLYDYPTYTVQFYVENGNIDTIRMVGKEETLKQTIDDKQKILAYYNSKANISNGDKNVAINQTQGNSKAEKATEELQKQQAIAIQPQIDKKETYDKVKLVETAKVVNTYFAQFVQIYTSKSTADEKTTALKNLEQEANLWDLGIKLEEHVVVKPGDAEMYNWLVKFTDTVRKAISNNLIGLTAPDNSPLKIYGFTESEKAFLSACALQDYYRSHWGN